MAETQTLEKIFENPYAALRNLVQNDFYQFIKYFWPEYSADEFRDNWHIRVIASELQTMAERVAAGKPKKHDLIINVPPGSSKTSTVSVFFPVWCWTNWYWMRFITASYRSGVSLESAVYARDIVKSHRFTQLFPELSIKKDKDTKENYKIVKNVGGRIYVGGNRFSSSIGGTMMGFHGNFLIMDDPIDPKTAEAETQINRTNNWINNTFLTRKTQSEIVPFILIQQRIHQNDPTGNILETRPSSVKHICLPGEIKNYRDQVKPQSLLRYYSEDGLLDPKRLSWKALKDKEAELGQYSYAGQIGQKPVPPGGGMFKVDNFQVIDTIDYDKVLRTVRYWDKAGTAGGGDYTVGIKMHQLKGNKWIVADMKRGQWGSDEREDIIKQTAIADGTDVEVWIEQEPGSGGLESAQATIRNLAGFLAYADRPVGKKEKRADPYSVQVNNGNVWILRGEWNRDFIEEHRYFPYSKHKDIIDASGGAWSKLIEEKEIIIY